MYEELLPVFSTALMIIFIIVTFAFYIYQAWALMVIGKKLNYSKPWLAWIPFANVAMVLQMGGFHWAWFLLLAIPIIGWLALLVIVSIALWRVYEQRNYPGYLALLPVLTVVLSFIPFLNTLPSIGHIIVFGLVAWVDKK